MQAELDPNEAVILGVNAVGLEGGNPAITADRTLPWLQDVPSVLAWDEWAVVYRDVRVLDQDGVLVGVFNLTEHDLAEPESYAALLELIESTID